MQLSNFCSSVKVGTDNLRHGKCTTEGGSATQRHYFTQMRPVVYTHSLTSSDILSEILLLPLELFNGNLSRPGSK